MRKNKKNLTAFKQFAKNVTSRLKIIGAMDWMNSLVFEINDANYYQIGVDQEDNETFIILHFENEEVVGQRLSKDPSVLEKWLQAINNGNY